ncbi:RNA-binding motif, single-stranded-interacting protein 1 isoform X6, partial [Tachysurus ichikawai]
PPVGPSSQPMAPPSPGTNSSTNQSSSSSTAGWEQLSKTNLYIRGLPPATTDHDLVKLCQPYGKIVSTKAILDKTTNKCKGYGFVDFDSPAAAQKAVNALKNNGVQAQMAKIEIVSTAHVASLKREGEGKRDYGYATASLDVYIFSIMGKGSPTEPLLCKFADGGQKKRQSQNKYVPNGRAWAREGEARLAGMTLTYDPTAAAMQNGFYHPYSITNRMIAQPAMSPYMSTYPAFLHVHNVLMKKCLTSKKSKGVKPTEFLLFSISVQTPSWVTHQGYIMQHPGAVLSPSMDPSMSLQPTSMMSPLSQQMSHLTLGSTGAFMPANAALQGAYIPQYTPMQPAAVEENSSQPQVESSGDHSPYAYQQTK